MRYMLMRAINLPWAPHLLHGLFLSSVIVSIAIMTDGAIAGYRLEFKSVRLVF